MNELLGVGLNGGTSSQRSTSALTPLYLARLPEPTCRAEIGERFLDLLVAGIDHELVGFDVWYDRILGDAPDVVADAGE